MRIGSVFSSHVTATQEYIFTEGHGRAPGELSIRGDLEARSHQILRELEGERRTPWDDVLAVHIHPLRWHWWVPFAALAGGFVMLLAMAVIGVAGVVATAAFAAFEVLSGLWDLLSGAEWREANREDRRKAGRETERDLRIRARREARQARRSAKKEAAAAAKRAKAERKAAGSSPSGGGAAVGGFGGWAPSGPAPKESVDIDPFAPWGNVAVRVVTVDGPVDTLVRQRLFVRTTRRGAQRLRERYAEFLADPSLRASLPDRDR